MSPAITAVSPEQFLQPLDFIRSEHCRQLQLFDQILDLATHLRLDLVRKEAAALLEFLCGELPLHTMDEDLDLFNLLRLRGRPEETIKRVLAQLEWEHNLDKVLRTHLVIDVKELAVKPPSDNPMRVFVSLRTFAEAQQRHVAWENSVVLPIAEQWLKPEDLEIMGRNMAARRGIAYPE